MVNVPVLSLQRIVMPASSSIESSRDTIAPFAASSLKVWVRVRVKLKS